MGLAVPLILVLLRDQMGLAVMIMSTQKNAATDITSIKVDAKELDIPYNMIIGRNSIM